MNSGKLCPKGWHVPGYEEWIILIDFLGGPNFAETKAKPNPVFPAVASTKTEPGLINPFFSASVIIESPILSLIEPPVIGK